MNRKIKTRNSSGGGKPSSKRPRSAGKRSSLKKRPLLKGSSPSTATAASTTTSSSSSSSSSSNKPPPPTTTTTSISTSSLEYRNLPATISDALFDNVCLLIACRRHEQLLLTRGTRRFLPCAPLTDSGAWEETAMEAALALLQDGENDERGGVRKGSSPFASFNLVHLLRVQLPQSERFITRLVFLATLGQNRSSCCCRNSLPRDSPVRWYPLEAAISGRLENAWGPEVAYFARLVASLGDEEENNFSVGDESIQEYSLADAFMYKMPPPTENDEGGEERASLRELLAQPSAISLSDVERAYADYLEHAFPSLFLSRTSFLFYLARHNILKEASGGGDLVKVGRRLFAAFSRRTGHQQQQQYLSFTELLLGLAAIEQRTRNGRARLAMVFRYYDENRDGLLSVAEFRLMMEHLVMQKSFASGDGSPASRSSAGSSSSSSSSSTCPSPRLSHAEVAEEMRRIGGTTGKDAATAEIVLSLEAFLKAVLGQKKLLKGTEQLVRVSANPFAQITRSMAARALLKQSGISGNGKSEAAAEVLVHRRYEGRCRGCSTGAKPPFQIAANIVRLNRRGECVDWTPVQRWPGRSSADADLLEQITFPSLPSSPSPSSSSPLPPSSEAGKSNNSASSSCRWLHNLHAKIRHHNSGGGKGTREAPLGLYHGGRGEAFLRFYAVVKRVVREVSALLEAEDRVLRVAEPVYIVGDLHGNLEDLLSIERCILRSSPHLTTNYLFLGDYVDRGRWGFEVFLYLAVAKLLNRDRVFLLRGNHEFRLTQEKYKFKEELLLKYGSTYGLKFWDLVNYVCDRLPVCAVVGGALFAAHGGIPFSLTDLGTINQQTPRVLPEPDRVAPWVWQMLWNDPMDWARFLEAAQLQKVVPSAANYTYMYLFNAKRGTAYVFNDYAAAAFLKANRLQAIIRAHEVPEELGVRFNFGRLCTTVFSCSHYTNRMNNECSVLLVGGEGRIRVLRIDTRLNKPAMM